MIKGVVAYLLWSRSTFGLAYSASVGSETVRNFRLAVQGRAGKGLIMTTGRSMAEARREATRDGAPPIDSIDGEAFCPLMKISKLGVWVREARSEQLTLDDTVFETI